MSELGGERPTLRHSSTYGNISTRTTGQNDNKNYSGTNFRSENNENSALLGKSFSAFPDSAREGTERFPILGTMDSTFSDLCKYWFKYLSVLSHINMKFIFLLSPPVLFFVGMSVSLSIFNLVEDMFIFSFMFVSVFISVYLSYILFSFFLYFSLNSNEFLFKSNFRLLTT